jgi:co-chaperonin GroES (HSP10)
MTNNKIMESIKQIVIPTGRKVLIKRASAPTHFPGTTLIIPDSVKKQEFKGTVVAVGSQEQEIKVGDFVQYADYAVPTSMEHNGEPHLLINAADVFAIIRTV